MAKSPYVHDAVMSKIEESADNSIFFLTDFAQYGAIETVRKILGEACDKKILMRVAHGIYAKPKESRFGTVPPSLETIASAIAERDHAQIMPTGAAAANYVGLSTQVPMTLSYLTTGTTRVVNVGDRVIEFKHAAPRNFAFKGTSIPLIIQALKEIGNENISESVISAIRTYLVNSNDKEYHSEDLLKASQWVQSVLKPIINNLEN